MDAINRVAVLGSGVMGGAIAAHLANCGIPSIMLDIVPPDLADSDKGNRAKRNAFADGSKARLLKAKPSPTYLKSNLDMIETGNFEDDLARVAECDWIIEVVREDVNIKRKLFAEVAKHRTPGTIVTTNTSGVPLHSMVDVMDEDMRKHFLGTHFFNPPRYLKLLEIIPAPDTLPEVIAKMATFCENVLGKGIVYAKDTPNFVANRLLTFGGAYILHEFTKAGLSVEDVDALTGPVVGHASSATFRTNDLVGLDTLQLVIGNVFNNCPDDEQRDLMALPDWVQKMIEKGYLGDKSGSGFYKKTSERDEKGKSIILSIDPQTLEYTPQNKTKFPCVGAARGLDDIEEKIRVMHTGDDPGSQFVWKCFANLAVYAGNRIPEISDDIVNIDNAVKWGFAWEIGIFEAWDALGVKAACDRMKEDGITPPPIADALLAAGFDCFYRTQNGARQYFDLASKAYKDVPTNPRNLVIKTQKETGKIVKENGSCTLVDLGDGIVCAEFHTKMNAIDPDLGMMMGEAIQMLNEGQFEGLVIANQGAHFCAGANVFVILGEAMQQNWDKIDEMTDQFQQANMALRACRGPVVAAPHHFTMGGGVEICQHADRCVIAGETYGGLVEVGVGLVPGGGGCKEMLRRALEYVPSTVDNPDYGPYIQRAVLNIAMAKVSTSGAEFIELGYLSNNDIVTPNLDQQVQKAKDLCRGMVVAGYTPPRPASLIALGEPIRTLIGAAIYNMQLSGYASEHDALITAKVANIISGGDRKPGTKITEQDVLDLEREAFLSLIGTEKTQQRIQAMLMTGKPLRN